MKKTLRTNYIVFAGIARRSKTTKIILKKQLLITNGDYR